MKTRATINPLLTRDEPSRRSKNTTFQTECHTNTRRTKRKKIRATGYKHSPSLHKVLPDVVLQSIGARKLLNEMLDCILPKTEEVRTRYAIAVLPISHMIRGAHDNRPRARRRPCNDRLVRLVRRDDLELGTVAAIKNSAMVHGLAVRIGRREIPPV